MSGNLATVARGRRPTPALLKLLYWGAGIALVGGGLYWWGHAPSAPRKAAPPPPQTNGQQFDFGRALHEPKAEPETAPPPPPPPKTPAPPGDAAPPPPPPPPTFAPTMSVWVRPGAAALLTQPPAPPPPPAPSEMADQENGPPSNGATSALAQSLQATHIAATKPRFQRFPPRYTINKGTGMLCTPPMALDTQLPGHLWCVTDRDVMSMDKTNRLIPAGSQVNFQIERGLGLGQDRAVLIATDVLTTGPGFLPIPLDIPGADSSGQAGVPVDVNDHTWKKLKMAALAGGIEGLAGAAQTALSQGGNQYIGSFGNQTQSLAAIFAQHDLNIPTTGYRGPGRPIMFMFNHYVDLSDFYEQVLR
jgi:type IV secretory pathway VirB10-like protein